MQVIRLSGNQYEENQGIRLPGKLNGEFFASSPDGPEEEHTIATHDGLRF